MARDVFPVTIVSDSEPVIDKLTRDYSSIPFDTQSSLKYIPGLMARQCLIPNEMELGKVRSLNRVWIHFHRNNFGQGPLPVGQPEIRFGSLVDLMTFSYHRIVRDIEIEFDDKRAEINIIQSQYHLRLAEDCLDEYFLIDRWGSVLIPLKKSMLCFQKVLHGRLTRLCNFTDVVTKENLADTTAICIIKPPDFYRLKEFLMDQLKLKCFHSTSPILMQAVDDNCNIQLPDGVDFLSHYVWQMVLSLGYHIKDRLDAEFMCYVGREARLFHRDHYPKHQFYKKVIAIYHLAKKNRFFNIAKEYDSTHGQWLPPLQLSYDYVPRIYLTPYGIYPRPLKPIRGNRVLRQSKRFGSPRKHYCRVTLRDCDLSSIQSDALEAWQSQLTEILLSDGLIIGQRHFEFLLFSNSQLRDRSLYFYRSFESWTAGGIRQWLGEFNHEKSVGTRIARMAQCFTSTIKGILLRKEQLVLIPDRFDAKQRCFTDGCGKISTSLIRKLFTKTHGDQFEAHRLPSVIQIRCGGIKGVLAHAPDLDGDVIHYRQSQMKFESDYLELELIKYSQPNGIALNQQLITLLEFLGVDRSIFIQCQNEYRKRLSLALISSKFAASLLDKTIRHYDWNKIDQSGFIIPEGPFIKSLLMTLIGDRLRRLRDKSHIPLSMDDGRMLYGIVDETNSLNEGEIFIQISKKTEEGTEELQIIADRNVLVTRMPCYHPGDVRILRAVDKPLLRHLVDCIVFPAKGNRPHPTEMSGGDLDGDEYWTYWNPLFVNQMKQREPLDYTAPEKPRFDGEITMEMMVNFIVDILFKAAHVGILSRRHLAICARQSPENQMALQLTRYINDALDFPKTGVSSMTIGLFRTLNVRDYPDFMQNGTKTVFRCDKALGHLFRQMEKTVNSHVFASELIQPILIDQDLLVPGYEKYLGEAIIDFEVYKHRTDMILNTYDLKSELELITGCHSNTPEEVKNSDDKETAGQECRSLRNETRHIFEKYMTDRTMIEREQKASAYYFVAYTAYNASITAGTNHRQVYLSFPWTMHELLCQIKMKRLKASATEKLTQSYMDKIGRVLINANPSTRQTTVFFLYLVDEWMKDMPQFILSSSFAIQEFCQTNQKFIKVSQSDETAESRIGKQFLMLIDFLSEANTNKPELQLVANEFLLKLHRIGVEDRV